MRPGREAVTLPLIFLPSPCWAASARALTGGMVFLAPELSYLVLGVS